MIGEDMRRAGQCRQWECMTEALPILADQETDPRWEHEANVTFKYCSQELLSASEARLSVHMHKPLEDELCKA